MKIWLDDIREAPDGWIRCHSVNEARAMIFTIPNRDGEFLSEMSLDHDLGDYADDGGDAIKLVLWMAEYDIWPVSPPEFHTANPVGRANMEAVVNRYGPY